LSTSFAGFSAGSPDGAHPPLLAHAVFPVLHMRFDGQQAEFLAELEKEEYEKQHEHDEGQ